MNEIAVELEDGEFLVIIEYVYTSAQMGCGWVVDRGIMRLLNQPISLLLV
jgi:hypothetical protein